MIDKELELQKAMEAVSTAKARLMLAQEPLLSSIIFQVKYAYDFELESSAATDGIFFIFNPVLVNKESIEELTVTLLHEALHVLLEHMYRKPVDEYDHYIYNIACDYAANSILKDAGYDLTGFIYEYKYHGWSVEKIYADLVDKASLPKVPKDIIYSNDTKEMQDTLIKALIVTRTSLGNPSNMYGCVPSDVIIQLEESLKPVIPWQNYLYDFMTSFRKDDYSYKRPNRIYLPDYYLPSLYNEGMGKLGVAFDTSGSVYNKLGYMVSEVKNIITQYQPELTTIVDFDTKISNIHQVTQYEVEDIASLRYQGTGGTDLRPVFDYFNKHPPELLIVFTDLYCELVCPTHYPVLWVCIDNPTACVNFGTLIHVDTEKQYD